MPDRDVSLDAAARAIADAVERAEGRLPPKKRAVIETAVICFAEQGYAGTATRTIAQRAGVAEATIFRHFATKRDLLKRLVAPLAGGLLLPAIEGEAAGLIGSGRPLDEVLKAIMLSRLDFADRYAPLVRILLQEATVNPDVREVFTQEIVAAILRIAERALAPRIAAGEIRAIPIERLLRWLFSLLIGYYVTRSMLAPGDWDDRAEVSAMVEAIAHGVLADKGTD